MTRLEWVFLAVIISLCGMLFVTNSERAANGLYAVTRHTTPEDQARIQKLRERVARIEGRLEAEGLLEKTNP